MMAEMISRIQLQPCLIMRGKKKKGIHAQLQHDGEKQEQSRKIKKNQTVARIQTQMGN